MKPLQLEEVLSIPDRATEAVHCPKWGGYVVIRSLSGCDRDAFDFWNSEAQKAGRPLLHMRAKVVAMSWCADEQGTPATITEDDVLRLSEKDGATLDMLFDRCWALSRLGGVKDAEKNSNGQSTDSG